MFAVCMSLLKTVSQQAVKVPSEASSPFDQSWRRHPLIRNMQFSSNLWSVVTQGFGSLLPSSMTAF